MREEGIGPGTSYAESAQKLKPRSEELLRWLYDEIVRRCREHDVVPMAGYIPHTGSIGSDPARVEAVHRQMEIAAEAGMVVLNLRSAYDGVDLQSLWIAPWDSHPNAEGHRLIAVKLYDELTRSGVLRASGT
jgi:hypothetical protein